MTTDKAVAGEADIRGAIPMVSQQTGGTRVVVVISLRSRGQSPSIYAGMMLAMKRFKSVGIVADAGKNRKLSL